MNQYYVILSKDVMDEKIGTIDALTLEEAEAIVKVRYQKSMIPGETLHIFLASESLRVDENDRFVLPEREIMSIGKIF